MTSEYYLALDIGGSAVKYSIMDSEGHFYHKGQYPTPQGQLSDLLTEIDKIVDEAKALYLPIKGVAISSCGAVNIDTGEIHGSSAIHYIHGPNWRKLISERYDLPCEIENDANCAALAEAWQGSGVNCNHFCMVVIGSGIGGANVINKQVLHGHHLHSGEFGYMIAKFIDEQPKTFSDMASTRGLIEAVCQEKSLPNGALNGVEVFQLAEQGDIPVQAIIDRWYRYLAVGLYNLQYALDPEVILIGGAISERKDLIEKINAQLSIVMSQLPHSKIFPRVDKCRLGNDANLIGALWHFLTKQGK